MVFFEQLVELYVVELAEYFNVELLWTSEDALYLNLFFVRLVLDCSNEFIRALRCLSVNSFFSFGSPS